jgi:hypothetical protein
MSSISLCAICIFTYQPPITLTRSQSALIAAVISGAFSWPTINAAPWTSKACFYAALVLSLTAIFSGSQQSIALHRIGGKTATRLRHHMWNRRDKEFVAYIWQLPVMMLNISIWLLLIGLLILIWDRAASSGIWGGDTKVIILSLLFNHQILETDTSQDRICSYSS